MRSTGSRSALNDAFKPARRARESKKPAQSKKAPTKAGPPKRHSVYVVYLRNPKGDGKAGYYVGMTGLTPEQRLANHLSGIKAARVSRSTVCG